MTPPATSTAGSTRALLAGGAIGGPLFIIAVVIQALTRAGFDPELHPLSLLSLGDLGWIQISNFIVSGVLFTGAAVGMRRVLHPGRAGSWGPWLIGAFGVSLVWSGVFVADPADGFPPGTPDGGPEQLSWHGILHMVGPTVAGLALIVACVVFARRFAAVGQRGWVGYSVAVAVAYPLLAFGGLAVADFRPVLAGGILSWSWASAIAAKLLLNQPTGRPA